MLRVQLVDFWRYDGKWVHFLYSTEDRTHLLGTNNGYETYHHPLEGDTLLNNGDKLDNMRSIFREADIDCEDEKFCQFRDILEYFIKLGSKYHIIVEKSGGELSPVRLEGDLDELRELVKDFILKETIKRENAYYGD